MCRKHERNGLLVERIDIQVWYVLDCSWEFFLDGRNILDL